MHNAQMTRFSMFDMDETAPHGRCRTGPLTRRLSGRHPRRVGARGLHADLVLARANGKARVEFISPQRTQRAQRHEGQNLSSRSSCPLWLKTGNSCFSRILWLGESSRFNTFPANRLQLNQAGGFPGFPGNFPGVCMVGGGKAKFIIRKGLRNGVIAKMEGLPGGGIAARALNGSNWGSTESHPTGIMKAVHGFSWRLSPFAFGWIRSRKIQVNPT